MSKDIEVVIVSYENFTAYDYVPQGSFYTMSATQEYYLYRTSSRELAQQKCNELFGDGFYKVIPTKQQATKFGKDNISQSYTATGVGTRKK